MPLKFSKPKPIGSIRAWQEAQAGFSRCCSIRWRNVPLSSFSLFNSGTSGGGGGGGELRKFSKTHLPRLTGEVRVGFDVTVRILACVSKPRRGVPARLTR